MPTIHERIKSRRTQLNMTQLSLAEAVGVREATINRYESAEIKNIKYDMIIKLSINLHCSPAYLMGWTDDPLADNNIDTPIKEMSILTPELSELNDILSGMTDTELDDLLIFARFLKEQRDKKK